VIRSCLIGLSVAIIIDYPLILTVVIVGILLIYDILLLFYAPYVSKTKYLFVLILELSLDTTFISVFVF